MEKIPRERTGKILHEQMCEILPGWTNGIPQGEILRGQMAETPSGIITMGVVIMVVAAAGAVTMATSTTILTMFMTELMVTVTIAMDGVLGGLLVVALNRRDN
jgi:hypothetical protein